jgi:sugar/nucleoside kinase (ribokinase family)
LGIGFAAVRALGVIGHLSRDLVAGTEPQIGGGPWHASRVLRTLGHDAVLFAKCGDEDYRKQVAALGLPLELSVRGATTGFSFSYDEDGVRTMAVDSIGEPWRVDDVPELLLRRVEWLHVAGLLSGDFDGEMLEWLARGRRLLLDAQGLVRLRQTGPLALDGGFDRALLRHVTVLKLAEEEARAIVGDAELESLRELGVPEVLVTFGRDGSLVITRDAAERVPARAISVDPTGAGDAYAASYVAARAGGHAPVSAARRATAAVAAMMSPP